MWWLASALLLVRSPIRWSKLSSLLRMLRMLSSSVCTDCIDSQIALHSLHLIAFGINDVLHSIFSLRMTLCSLTMIKMEGTVGPRTVERKIKCVQIRGVFFFNRARKVPKSSPRRGQWSFQSNDPGFFLNLGCFDQKHARFFDLGSAAVFWKLHGPRTLLELFAFWNIPRYFKKKHPGSVTHVYKAGSLPQSRRVKFLVILSEVRNSPQEFKILKKNSVFVLSTQV